MDHRYYTLQALKFTKPNSKRLDEIYVVKLFNDRGIEVGRVDRYPCGEGVEGDFQRSIDVLMMEQALEKATGQIIPVEK